LTEGWKRFSNPYTSFSGEKHVFIQKNYRVVRAEMNKIVFLQSLNKRTFFVFAGKKGVIE
jgi:hypothetical protein